MPGSNGLDGPMGMNGTDAVLLLNNVDLFSSCQYFYRNCNITSIAGCPVPAFPVVPEVRMHEQMSIFYYFTYYLEF